jgi:hypothetical protein
MYPEADIPVVHLTAAIDFDDSLLGGKTSSFVWQ